LLANFNQQPALVPASPWLGGEPPPTPNLSVIGVPRASRLTWGEHGTNFVRWWVVQTKSSGEWKTEILPRETTSESLPGSPEIVAVTAIDRVGNASPPRVLQEKKNPGRERILLKE
jgi:hypothetical protein